MDEELFDYDAVITTYACRNGISVEADEFVDSKAEVFYDAVLQGLSPIPQLPTIRSTDSGRKQSSAQKMCDC